ncbi:SEC-C metal-binding domain-containing protein [Zavarzinella formosa]|uniref:SEC-C metal-binding domain-containing protein n=1 Tax=Zavarzinella formosa TaxID=360055 RepID=UPI001930A8F4
MEKVGRNDPCPCESGKLFKKCCLNSGCFRWREPASLLSGNDFRKAGASLFPMFPLRPGLV